MLACLTIRERLLRFVQVQPDLRAHQPRFAVAAVGSENLAEHALGVREFVLVLEQPGTPDCDLWIARIARAS